MVDTNKQIVVFGAGGHASVVIDALELSGRQVAWLVDDDKTLHGRVLDGRSVRSPEQLMRAEPFGFQIANGIGSVKHPQVRQRIYEQWCDLGFSFVQVIHPSAIISPSAQLAEGTQLMAGCVVQTRATVGVNTLINTRTAVDHDCVIGDHCHLAPGVTLSGNVTVGNGCHLGTGVSVIQGITIGEGSFVAAGAVVTKDLPPGSSVRGVPARPFGGKG